MTADEIKKTVRKHNKAAIIGGAAGLLLLVGYIAYESVATPGRPDVRTAGAAEIVAYIANDRGLSKLAQIQQREFLQQWRDTLTQDAGKKDDLRACLETLDEDLRKAFTDSMFKHFKKTFLDDAKQFNQLAENQKYGFLKSRIIEGREQIVLLKGITAGLKGQYTGSQDDFQKWLIEHTTPEERALGEPFYNALKRIRPQVDKDLTNTPPTSTGKV